MSNKIEVLETRGSNMVGNYKDITCAHKKEVLSMRDSWIRKWGVTNLVKDYKSAYERSRK